jgi:hypothetical protein
MIIKYQIREIIIRIKIMMVNINLAIIINIIITKILNFRINIIKNKHKIVNKNKLKKIINPIISLNMYLKNHNNKNKNHKQNSTMNNKYNQN